MNDRESMGRSRLKPLARERRLTKSQHTTLEKVEIEHRFKGDLGACAVVGWDTAVSGPLVTLDRFGETGPFVAITPTGRIIPDRKGPLE